MAHCLAGTPELPPVQIMAHHPSILDKWGREGRRIEVFGSRGSRSSYRIGMPDYVGPDRQLRRRIGLPQDHIDNLIISTDDSAIVKTMIHLQGRISKDTVICILSDGLGVVEHLNRVVFRDPPNRPSYVLGHMTHRISRHPDMTSLYTIHLQSRGHLHLTALPRAPSEESEEEMVAHLAAKARTRHLIKLLCSVPGLDVMTFPMRLFLRHKLEDMVFSSVTDSLSVMLGCGYELLYQRPSVRHLWNRLVQETIKIIASLPELENNQQAIDYFLGRNFPDTLWARLKQQDGVSRWIAMIREGRSPPVRYVNGWFVERAQETGAACDMNDMMMTTVLARLASRREELKADLPLYNMPYMLDGDLVQAGSLRREKRMVYVYNGKDR